MRANSIDIFSRYLAPLNPENFSEVVEDVEDKLKIVTQTLSMLSPLLESQEFDVILGAILHSLTVKTGELLGADRTTIFLLDDDQDELWSMLPTENYSKPIEIRLPLSRGLVGEVAQSQQILNIPYDFYHDPRSETAQEFDKRNHYRTYSILVLPILTEHENKHGQMTAELVAVVQLINKLKSSQDPDEPLKQRISYQGFTDKDLRVFKKFAPSLRLILESSRSFYKLSQRQRSANALIEATNSLIKGSPALDATMSRVTDNAKQLMNADRSILWLLNDDKTQLLSNICLPDGKTIELTCPVGVGFSGYVGETGEILNIGYDAYEHPIGQTVKAIDEKTKYRTCSLLCMPVLNSDGELMGVIQLVNKIKRGGSSDYNPDTWPEVPDCWKVSFNRNDQERMEAFNIQAGAVLQNAKLFSQLKNGYR